MIKRIYSTFILIYISIIPAAAQDKNSDILPSILYPAQIAFLLCAMIIAAYYARAAFDAPPIELGDGPTLPWYMTQPRQYRIAVIAYIVICLAFYDLGAYFFRDLLPLADFVAPAWLETLIQKVAAKGLLSFPLTVVLAAAVFFILLKKNDTEWNPLLLLRRLVWGWASIPQFANAIMLTARDALDVPIRFRAGVARHPGAPYVDVGDFDKDRNSLDRNWAELCYIRLSLAKSRAEGLHHTFFNEPSFAWENLDADYATARGDVALVKQPIGHNGVPDLADVSRKVKALRAKYCKLEACFLLFKNETKDKVIKEAIEFGIPMSYNISRSNPIRYLFVFVVGIIVSIYVGVTVSAMVWDLLHGYNDMMNQESDLITRWTGYSLANYGMPILIVLVMSYLGWTVNHNQPASYPISYARIFIIALCVSAFSLAFAVKFVSSSSLAAKPFFELLLSEFKWSLSPALVTLYIAYHVDRQIDPLLPDIASWDSGHFRQRIVMCVIFAMIVAWLSLQPTLTLTPSSPTTWPVDKLRAVILGTTFTVGLVMALVSEFCLIKPTRAATPGASLPSNGDGIDAHFPQPPDALPSR
jgi:hypothetical protein